MASAAVDSLADPFSKMSLDKIQPNVTVKSTGSSTTPSPPIQPPPTHESLELPKRSPPTLLTLPQELRNAIFAYVYATAESNTPIFLEIVSTYPSVAEISSYEAPPTKASLLVCKQLYLEFKEMQAASLQRYWTTQTFLINSRRARPANLHQTIVHDKDLKHVFSLHVECYINGIGHLIVELRFGTESGWTGTVESAPFDRTLESVGGLAQPSLVQQMCLNLLRFRFDHVMGMFRRKRLPHCGRVAMEPTAGYGFDTSEVWWLCYAAPWITW